MRTAMTRREPTVSRLLLLPLALSTLALGFAGCGSSLMEEPPPSLSESTHALSETSCITLHRGAEGSFADASISSQQPGHSTGSQPQLQVGQLGHHSHYGLLRVDTSAIPPQATLTSATLTVWRQGPAKEATLRAHAILAPWQEPSVTWAGFASAFAPQSASSAQTGGPSEPISLSVTGLVSTWVRHPALNHGLLLEQPEGHSLLASSEHPDSSRRPHLRVCYFLPDSSPATSSAPSLLLQVMDDSGQPLSGAAVSSGPAALPTDGAGYVLLDNLVPGFFSARVEAVGFAPAVVSLHLPPGARASRQLRLQPMGSPLPFVAEAGATLERGSVRVTIPPRSIVDLDGNPVSGVVQATLVPLDPTTAPTSTLPGPLEGLPSPDAAESVPLESFFMADVSLWQDGKPLQLAPNASATLELLLPESAASRLSPGDSVPAWWLDTAKGLWVREGAGTVQASAMEPGRLSWVVQVNHFTWWNCDRPITEWSCVDVQVVSHASLPMPGVQLGARGVDYTGLSSTVFTGPDGRACVTIKQGGTARVIAGPPDQPAAEALVTGSEAPTACGGGACAAITLTLAPPVCTPGETLLCAYSGPPGTENVGLCRASHRYCNSAGTGWGACVGEVLPAPETCSNTFDENCDGSENETCQCDAPCYEGPQDTLGVGACQAGVIQCAMNQSPYCRGQKLPSLEVCSTAEDDNCDGATACVNPLAQGWRFGGAACEYSQHVLAAPDGGLFLTGQFQGVMDLGNGIILSSPTMAFFIARLDATTRTPQWATQLSSSWFELNPVRLDASGNPLLSGRFSGNLTLGNTSLLNPQGDDGFVAKLDGASGTLRWVIPLVGTGPGSAIVKEPLPDSSGGILLVSYFFGNFTLGETDLPNPYGSDLVVARLDGDTGAPLWVFHPNVGGGAWPHGAVLDIHDNLILTGHFEGDLTVGDTTYPNPYNYDGFALKLEGTSGAPLWLAHFQGTNTTFAYSPAVDANGHVLLMGVFHSNLTVGSTTLANPTGYDGFATRLDGTSGAPLWLSHLASTGNVSMSDAAPPVDADGNLFIQGRFSGALTVGGTTLANPTGYDGFVARLDDASGVPSWLSHLASTSDVFPGASRVDASGDLILTGHFEGHLTLGGTPLPNPGGVDGFVTRLAGASGVPVWLSHLAGSGFLWTDRLLLDGGNNLFVTGYSSSQLTFGGVPITGSTFMAKVLSGTGALDWAQSFTSFNVNTDSVALDSTGNLFVAGSFSGGFNLGGSYWPSAGCSDIFLGTFPAIP